jgi:hypothetical protein
LELLSTLIILEKKKLEEFSTLALAQESAIVQQLLEICVSNESEEVGE